jgi:hypothetical protein
LFVKKNPDLLPEVYDQEDIKRALAGQSEIHQRLLISSRNSYKSTYNLIDLLSWVLCFGGDIRILMVSATQPLSAGFLKLFRAYWTLKNPNDPTLFNQLFPEHMVEPGEGSKKSFTSPMRQLDLIQPTLMSSSLDTEGLAGERADLLCCEDVAEINNSSNPEQREKTLEKFDMLRELLEPTGFLQVIGTPFAPGDIYSTILDREKQSETPSLLYQINPAWRVKSDVKKEPYDLTLISDEVELLFPTRLTFAYLKTKLRENVKQFRQQSLCSWVPDADSELKLTFDEDVLRRHIRPISYFDGSPLIGTYVICDPSLSTNAKADPTCIIAMQIRKFNGEDTAIIADCDMDRYRQSEIVEHLLAMIYKHSPNNTLVERTGNWESLREDIHKLSRIRGLPTPNIYFKPTNLGGVTLRNKYTRIKNLEKYLAADRLWFIGSGWTDEALGQVISLGPIFHKSSATRHDDFPDAVALGVEAYMPRHLGDLTLSKKNPEQEAQEKAARDQERLKAWTAHIFGTTAGTPQARPVEAEPELENPLFRGLGSALRRN